MDYSHLVCQEQQDCSNAIFSESTENVNAHSQHVACEDYHDKLGQCSTFKGPCTEGHVSVYCVGMYKYTSVSLIYKWGYLFSEFIYMCVQQYLSKIVFYYFPGGVNFSTSEHCGGEIFVNYRKKWEKVCLQGFPAQFKEKLCQELGCRGYYSNFKEKETKRKKVVIILLHQCVLPESMFKWGKMSCISRSIWKQLWTALWNTMILSTVLFRNPVKMSYQL